MDLLMGLGKTRIAIESAVRALDVERRRTRVVFVTRPDVCAHIREEIARYTDDDSNVEFEVFSYTSVPSPYYCDWLVVDECHDVYKKKVVMARLATVSRSFVVLLTGSSGSSRELARQFHALVGPGQPLVFRSDTAASVVVPARQTTMSIVLGQGQRESYNQKVEAVKSASGGVARTNMMRSLREFLSNEKVPSIGVALKSCSLRKVVLFSAFRSTLLLLRLTLPKQQTVWCDGTVSQSRRRAALTTFRSDSSKRFLVLSLGLFSHGVDLGYCNGLVLCEPPWSGAEHRQTLCRLQRIGQANNQEILLVVCDDTLEAKLLASNSVPTLVV